MKKILLVVSFALSLVCTIAIASPDNNKVNDIKRVNSCVDSLKVSSSDILICEDKGGIGIITLKVKFNYQDSIDFESSGAVIKWSVGGNPIAGIINLDAKFLTVTVPTPTTTTTFEAETNPPNIDGCNNSPNGTVQVVVKLIPTDANAGLSQTGNATCGLTSINLAAVKVAQGHGTGTWTFDGDGDGGVFANPKLFNTAFTGTPDKLYTVRWTTSNAPCAASTDTAQVLLHSNPDVAVAGADSIGAETCGKTSIKLLANTPVKGTGAWSIVSGAGGNFGNVNNAATPFDGVAGTAYVLRWTISKAPCASNNDDVNITLNENPDVANAGADSVGAETCGKTSIKLLANTPVKGIGAWSIVSGAGGNIGNTNNAASTFDGVAGTAYVLRWTISKAPCANATDDINIKLNENPDAAKAGADSIGAENCGKTSIALNANAPVKGTGSWSVTSGTGGSFGDNLKASTSFTGTPEVAYTLTWTISNAPCASASDDVKVTLHTQTDSAKAGVDQTGIATCGKTGVQISGNVPTIGTGAWTIIGNGGVLVDQNAATTDLNGLADSTYKAIWTITNAPCRTTADTMLVKFNANPTKAFAGNDSSICGATTITLNGNSPIIGSGAWAYLGGDTTGISKTLFSDDSNPKSTFTGKSGKVYSLVWNIVKSPCGISTDTVNIEFKENPIASASNQSPCIIGKTGAVTLDGSASNGTGVWTKVSGNGIFNGNSFEDATETTNVLKWKVTGQCGADSVTVTINLKEKPSAPIIGGPDSVELCKGGTVLLTATSVDAANNNVSFQWYNHSELLVTVNPLQVTVADTGRYYIIANNVNGCSNSSNSIKVKNREIDSQNLNDTICQGVNYKIQPFYFKGNKFLWSKADSVGVIGTDTILTINIKEKQRYVLSVNDSICGQLAPYNFFIDVYPQSEAALVGYDSICLGNAVELTVDIIKGSAPRYVYHWYTDSVFVRTDSLTKEWVLPTATTTKYQVAVQDTNGCISSAEKIVKALDWDLNNQPNIFTPNGDSKNDALEINKAPHTSVAIEVYNRWGGQIFKADDYDNKWDGGAASDGIYYYTLKASCPNKTVKKWIQIAR